MTTNSENIPNILIPMAGAGSRFVNAGFNVPKPLIRVLDKTMVEWAMQSFNFLDKIQKYRLIFIVPYDHVQNHGIDTHLKKLFGNETIIISTTSLLNGQSKSCLLAKQYINNDNQLFIYNCDTYMKSNIWDVIMKDDPDGVIPCFEAVNPNYSYVKIDDSGNISEVAEKQAVSNLATIGMYYFKRGADYVRAAEWQIEKNETYNNEFYVGPCYNVLISEGKKIKTALIDEKWVLGSPEELENFVKNYHK